MIDTLATVDAQRWLSVLVKTLGYAATLIAAGSVFAAVGLRELTESGQRSLRRIAIGAALAAAVLSALRIPLRASFLMGGTFEGAADPLMLDVVAGGPLGVSVLVRLFGLALILAMLAPVRGARWVACAGGLVTCVSFALRGHALGEPRLLLGASLTVHIAGLAFWLGAFAPLALAMGREAPARAGALAHEFGSKALWVVAALMAAGGCMFMLLGAASLDAVGTSYGQAFLLKVGLLTGVLGFAAVNKLRLTPALLAGAAGAARRLRRSIAAESALVLAVLATTAALTTLTSPPPEKSRDQQAVQPHRAPLQPKVERTAASVTGDPP